MRKVTKIIITIILIALCLLLAYFLTMRTAKKIFPLRYEEYIEQYSEEYDLDKYEVMSVIYLGSKYAPLTRKDEKLGLMQLPADTIKGVAKELGIEYSPELAFDIETNIRMGCFYLDYLRGIYPAEDTFLIAYSVGPGIVQGWLEDDVYTMDGETIYNIPDARARRYVSSVHRYAKVYEFLY